MMFKIQLDKDDHKHVLHHPLVLLLLPPARQHAIDDDVAVLENLSRFQAELALAIAGAVAFHCDCSWLTFKEPAAFNKLINVRIYDVSGSSSAIKIAMKAKAFYAYGVNRSRYWPRISQLLNQRADVCSPSP